MLLSAFGDFICSKTFSVTQHPPPASLLCPPHIWKDLSSWCGGSQMELQWHLDAAVKNWTVFLSLACSILGQINAGWVVWASSLLLEVLQWDWMCVATVKMYTWGVVKNPSPPWNIQLQTTFLNILNTYMKTWTWRKMLWVPTLWSLLLGWGGWWRAAAHLGAERRSSEASASLACWQHIWPGHSLTPVLSKEEKENTLLTSIPTIWHFAELG